MPRLRIVILKFLFLRNSRRNSRWNDKMIGDKMRMLLAMAMVLVAPVMMASESTPVNNQYVHSVTVTERLLSIGGFSGGCSADCSSEVTSTFGDQTAFCAMESTTDTSCLDDCSLSPESVDAHCLCSSNGLFYSYFFDLSGAPYCCGNEACQSAIVSAYVADSSSQTEAEALASLTASCAAVNTCADVVTSYQYTERCTDDCSSEFTAAYDAQDHAALCAAGTSACLNDCGLFGSTMDAHCACDTEAFFTDYNMNFTGVPYCCQNSEACHQAITDLYLESYPNFDGDRAAVIVFLNNSCTEDLLCPLPSVMPTALPSFSPTYPRTASPTNTPTPSPSQLPSVPPSPLPSKQPSQLPTGTPSMHPTQPPTVPPSKFLTKVPTIPPSIAPSRLKSLSPFIFCPQQPTGLPTLRPSMSPFPVPSSLPSSTPSLLRVQEPSSSPVVTTASPTSTPPVLQPSLSPSVGTTESPSTLSPTLGPTLIPSMQPSTSDIVKVVVSLTITASAPPSDADQTSLRSSVAGSVGLPLSSIRNFAISTTALDRRRTLLTVSSDIHRLRSVSKKHYSETDIKTGRLLASYSWGVSFDIVQSLSSTTFASPAVFSNDVITKLGMSTFVTSLVSGIASVTLVGAPSVVLVSRLPTIAPNALPTLRPTPAPTSVHGATLPIAAEVVINKDDAKADNKDEFLSLGSTTVVGILGGFIGLVVIALVARRCSFRKTEKKKTGKSRKLDPFPETNDRVVEQSRVTGLNPQTKIDEASLDVFETDSVLTTMATQSGFMFDDEEGGDGGSDSSAELVIDGEAITASSSHRDRPSHRSGDRPSSRLKNRIGKNRDRDYRDDQVKVNSRVTNHESDQENSYAHTFEKPRYSQSKNYDRSSRRAPKKNRDDGRFEDEDGGLFGRDGQHGERTRTQRMGRDGRYNDDDDEGSHRYEYSDDRPSSSRRTRPPSTGTDRKSSKLKQMAALHGVDIQSVKPARYYRNQDQGDDVPGLASTFSISNTSSRNESGQTQRKGTGSGSRRKEPSNIPAAPLDDALSSISQTFSSLF